MISAGAGMAGALALMGSPASAAGPEGSAGMARGMPSKPSLPSLPYAYDALEPVIDAQTLKLHHDKHHAGYVKGFIAALEGLEKARRDGDYAAIKALSRAAAFHGSGHVFHSIYWESMKPGGGAKPSTSLLKAIERDFGSMKAMEAQFKAVTKAVEASGWGVLAMEPMTGRLMILQAEKHQDLTIWGCQPLMVCDVWEHAYYLNYQNRRGDYVDKFCTIIDWGKVSKRCEAMKV
jgi:Fe-Mn family superoxide dismutase